ncbi:MAG: DUF2225 domain-containing protein [Chitinispirillaceae bacterium]
MKTDKAEVKRRLLLLIKDVNLVNEYIRRFGHTIDIKNIKAVKENRNSLNQTNQTKNAPGKEPVFEIKVSCPICGKTDITCYELRAKSQQIKQNLFLLPVYSGANGYPTTDYSLLSVTVCPECLFASPDKKDFNRKALSGSKTLEAQHPANLVSSLKDRAKERKMMLTPIVNFENYFKAPRCANVAIDSYRLAMTRAQMEAWFEMPYSYFKQGFYALKIAKIQQDAGMDNSDTLNEALGFFEEAYRTSNCASDEHELQVIYLIIAIMLTLGDAESANSYLSVFSDLKNERIEEMKKNPVLNTFYIDKWTEKARYLWEERENPDIFKM